MKRLLSYLNFHKALIAAWVLMLIMTLQVWQTIPQLTASELEAIRYLHANLGIIGIRSFVAGLCAINLALVYLILKQWFGARFAGLSAFLVVCIPLWTTTQSTSPIFTGLLTCTLAAFLTFDKAGRSDNPTLWYALCGLTTAAAWIIEPIGTSILMVLGTLLLIGLKPKYLRHITRQASLVMIILVVSVGALAGLSLKFNLGVDKYLANHLHTTIRFGLTSLWRGPNTYRFGLPGVSLIPLAVAVVAGLGVWQLIVKRRRPRNLFMVAYPVAAGVAALMLSGLSVLQLISVGAIGVAVWSAFGLNWLYQSWHKLFPSNYLAQQSAHVLVAILLISFGTYSYWYVVRAWSGNPQMRIDVPLIWEGRL